jgi:pimeloyl-ACP methyl ester carboxylesterase
VPHRSGYAPNPPLERIDFERQADETAELLEPGDHLVGHSYGGVVSLLAAAKRPDLGSLTVVEPPAFGVARGQPAVDELVAALERHFAASRDPVEYLAGYLPLMGSRAELPTTLSPDEERNVRSFMTERNPWEADVPLGALRGLAFSKLVVSGGHHPAFEAVCDVLEDQLPAERATITGARHSPQRTGDPLNRLLADFVGRAEQSRTAA